MPYCRTLLTWNNLVINYNLNQGYRLCSRQVKVRHTHKFTSCNVVRKGRQWLHMYSQKYSQLFLSKVREQKMTLTNCLASFWHSGRGAWAVTGSLGRQGVLGGGRAWVWRRVVWAGGSWIWRGFLDRKGALANGWKGASRVRRGFLGRKNVLGWEEGSCEGGVSLVARGFIGREEVLGFSLWYFISIYEAHWKENLLVDQQTMLGFIFRHSLKVI